MPNHSISCSRRLLHLRHIDHKSIYRAYILPYIRHNSINTDICNRIPYCAYVLPRIRYDSTNINMRNRQNDMRLIDQDLLNALQFYPMIILPYFPPRI